MKNIISGFIGIVGGGICMALGGWDYGLKLLVILMIVDYLSGIAVASLSKSPKTPNGGLSSKAGIAGLMRKMMMLSFVLIGHYVDMTFGVGYIRDAIVVGFCANEFLSIIENAGLMGLPLPSAVEKVVEILKDKEDGGAQHGA